MQSFLLALLSASSYAYHLRPPSSFAPLIQRQPARARSVEMVSALDASFITSAADVAGILVGDTAASSGPDLVPAIIVAGSLAWFLGFPVVARKTGIVTVPEWFPEPGIPDLSGLELPGLPSIPVPTPKALAKLALIGTTFILPFFFVALIVVTTPGVRPPFSFLDGFYPPRIEEVKQQKAYFEKLEVEKKAKADAEAKAKAAAEAAALAEKAAAKK